MCKGKDSERQSSCIKIFGQSKFENGTKKFDYTLSFMSWMVFFGTKGRILGDGRILSFMNLFIITTKYGPVLIQFDLSNPSK